MMVRAVITWTLLKNSFKFILVDSAYPVGSAAYNILWVVGARCAARPSRGWGAAIGAPAVEADQAGYRHATG